MADDKPNAVEDFINKYGIQVALFLVLAVIGVALILWNKFADSKDKKAWHSHLGWGLAITGLVMGAGTVLHSMSQESKDDDSGDHVDDDVLPDDQIPAF